MDNKQCLTKNSSSTINLIQEKHTKKGSRTAIRLLQGKGPVVKLRRVAENTYKDTKSKKELNHRDAFQPCSRVSSGGRTGRETDRKAKTEKKTDSMSNKELNSD